MPEKSEGDGQARHDNFVTAVHHAGKTRISRNHAFASDIADGWTQILGQCSADKFFEIETG